MRLSPAAEAAQLQPFLDTVAATARQMVAATTCGQLNLARGNYNEACDTLAAARRSLCGPGEAQAHEAWRDQCASSDYYHA